MDGIEVLHLVEEPLCTLCIAEAIVAQGKHIVAVDEVEGVEIAFPHQEVWERHSKVVERGLVEDMLAAEIDKAVEPGPGMILVAEGP